MYIYQRSEWPHFTWQPARLEPLLGAVRHQQGRVLGQMQARGFLVQAEATLQTLTLDVLKSSEIEGEHLPADQVRSSLARRLGLDVGGLVPAERRVDGVVEMLLDATQQFNQELTAERLQGWQAALFPAGRSGLQRVAVEAGRTGPMQVVSGAVGREQVHFEAPDAGVVDAEMARFLAWFNGSAGLDAVLKAAVAHLWFVTIHPFEDGNGRLTRAITDLQLARADGTAQRFYSLSAQIRAERAAYYAQLEAAQKGGLDITAWLGWFLGCLGRALAATEHTLAQVLAGQGAVLGAARASAVQSPAAKAAQSAAGWLRRQADFLEVGGHRQMFAGHRRARYSGAGGASDSGARSGWRTQHGPSAGDVANYPNTLSGYNEWQAAPDTIRSGSGTVPMRRISPFFTATFAEDNYLHLLLSRVAPLHLAARAARAAAGRGTGKLLLLRRRFCCLAEAALQSS